MTLTVLALAMAAGVVVRLPLLASVRANFSSDEAVNALVMQHMLRNGEIALWSWDEHYYGMVESLLALPFAAAGLDLPLAARLGTLVAFLALQLGTFMLGRRLYGSAAGLAAAALLAAFSPQFVSWSVEAVGACAVVVAWGTFTVLQYDRVRRQPSGASVAALGFMIGFGLYIYELDLVYVATLAAAWALAWVPLRWLRAGPPTGPPTVHPPVPPTVPPPKRRELLRRLPPALARGGLFVIGFLAGAAPKLALLARDTALAGKRPAYHLASPAGMVFNLKTLLFSCGPSLLGVNPGAHPDLDRLSGASWALSRPLGAALVAVYALAWGAAAWRVLAGSGLFARHDSSVEQPAPAGRLVSTETVLVLLVPVTALAFVASPNVVNAYSNHYLLPIMTSLPLLAADLLVRIARRAPAAAWALAALLVLFPLVQIARWLHAPERHCLGPGLRLQREDQQFEAVLHFLEDQGIHAAYSTYWVAFRATALSGERVVVTALDWDRYPPYARAADAAPREAYIFFGPREAALAGVDARLVAAGRGFTLTTIPPFLIYTDPAGGRLLPPLGEARPLVQPRAELTARPPAVWAAGAVADVPVTVRNRGAETLPAFGKGSRLETLAVAVSYHWLDAEGRPVVFEGQRTLLPGNLPPGAATALVAEIMAPPAPGRYQLCLTLVQEGVVWFDQAGAGAALFPVEVSAAPAPGAPGPVTPARPGARAGG